ncbi:MAG: dienelactone hydrolase family protein, partial [Nitrospinota bacterium]
MGAYPHPPSGVSWKRRAAWRLAPLAALLLGGCFSLPPAEIAALAPPPRHEGELRPFHYPGAGGEPIEGYFALPAGPSAPAQGPCLLFLHGQIGFWRSYRPYALQLARLGYGVLYINYYSARVVNLKEGIRPFDERVERLRLTLEDMARGVDALGAHPRCGRGGVTVVGFSLGGSYAFHVAALRPGKVAAVVSFYGGYRFEPLMDTWDIRVNASACSNDFFT